jgi:branched-chain amino acid aminotransferase
MATNPYQPSNSLKVYLNGELVPADQAAINVFDHGLIYGDGVFEGIRSYNGKVFEADAHVTRLFDSARAIRLTIPMTPDDMKQAIRDTLAANNVRDGYVRVVVTRGVGTLGLNPSKTAAPSVFIIADQIELYPPEMYKNGMACVIGSVVRNHPNAISPRIKSLNYLNNILAKIEGVDAGVPETIMMNPEGLVAEATGDNIFIVRDEQLQTPPTSAGILEGITRAVVMRLAGENDIPLEEKNLTRFDLYVADECFFTGTAAEVIPVTQIDGRPIGDAEPGPITRRLMDAFHAITRGNHE